MRTGIVAAVLAAGVLAGSGVALAATQGHAARTGYSVSLKPVSQGSTWDCVPATSSMFLQSFRLKASMQVLAVEMRTVQGVGTWPQYLIQVLDSYLAPWHMDVTERAAISTPHLEAMIAASLRSGHPVFMSVWANLLPWGRTIDHGAAEAHMILVTGITGQTVTVFDPRPASRHGGWHTTSVAALKAAARRDVPAVIAVGRI